MSISPVPIRHMAPLSNITPFTYSDGWTYLQVLTRLREYLQDVLTPEFAKAIEDTYNEFQTAMDEYHAGMTLNVEQFNQLFNDYVANVEARFLALAEPMAREAVDKYLSNPSTLDNHTAAKIDDDSSATSAAVERHGRKLWAPITATEYVFPTGGDDTKHLQAACDKAGVTGRVRVYGDFKISGPVWCAGNFDGGGASVTVTSVNGGLRFGQENRDDTRGVTIIVPRVIFGPFNSATDWDNVSTGVVISNVVGSHITIHSISHFHTGLQVIGQAGKGNAYNTFYIGRLENNRRNLLINAITDGWSNSNTFIGGQFSHLNNRGQFSTGTRNILLTGTGKWSRPNNNVFINPSIETHIAEHMLDIDKGSFNTFIGARFEFNNVTGTTRWGPEATNNMIVGGYFSERIREVFESGSRGNTIIANSGQRTMGYTMQGGMSGGYHANNTSSSDAPVYTAYGPNWSGDTNSSDWLYMVNSRGTKWKSAADAHPRMEIDTAAGLMKMGSGNAEATVGIGRAGTALRIDTPVATQPTAGAGGATALPATPTGYAIVYIDGAMRRIAYY